MSRKVLIRDARGERAFERADLPLVFGGDDADVAVPGMTNGMRVAFLGLAGDAPFLQPAEQDGTPVFVNGERLAASRWLKSGDVLTLGDQQLACEISATHIGLSVAGRDGERDTLPPVAMPIVAAPAAEALPAERTTGAVERIAPAAFVPTAAVGRRLLPRLNLAPVLLMAALAVLATAAWYMFTARPVLLSFVPEPDRITIDGSADFGLRDRYLLRPGTYTVVAEKSGFETAVRDIEVTRADGQSHLIELVKLPGLIDITTGAVADAVVTIDDEVRGSTPIEGLELRPGAHTVTVTAPGYIVLETELDVVGGGERQSLALTLTANLALLSVTSTPSGASVLVDGEPAGTTPFEGNVGGGERTLALKLPGHKTWETQLAVTAGEPLVVEPVTLEVADGKVSVRTVPPGAAVTVNGQYRGQAPLRLELPPNKKYRLGFSLAGHEPASRSVTVAPNEGASVSVTLAARLGDVNVAASPADAVVFVDGWPRGAANQTLSLSAVPHRIEIRKDGYETHAVTITPTPGFAQAISATLASARQAVVAAVPTTVKTAGGYELIRVAPGSFTMGASRREPGRRANEVLRPAQLTRSYYIGAKVVTNAEFARFDGGHDSGNVRGVSLSAPEHPVVNVDWQQAAAYCNWLSQSESLPPAYVNKDGTLVPVTPMSNGYRLPTEAEWVWAARYAAGQSDSRYPWGEAMPPPAKSGNYADASAGRLVSTFIGRYHDGFSATSPVGSFPPNKLGLYDVGGNVAEWMHDYYAVNPSTGRGPSVDPFGPPDGVHRVVRGTGWMHGSGSNLRLAYRDYSDAKRADVGFRIVRYAE